MFLIGSSCWYGVPLRWCDRESWLWHWILVLRLRCPKKQEVLHLLVKRRLYIFRGRKVWAQTWVALDLRRTSDSLAVSLGVESHWWIFGYLVLRFPTRSVRRGWVKRVCLLGQKLFVEDVRQLYMEWWVPCYLASMPFFVCFFRW